MRRGGLTTAGGRGAASTDRQRIGCPQAAADKENVVRATARALAKRHGETGRWWDDIRRPLLHWYEQAGAEPERGQNAGDFGAEERPT